MAQEILVVLSVVVPDEPPDNHARIRDLRGRELPGVPGSWVTRVGIHAYARALAESEARAGAEPGDDGLTDDEREHELDLDFGAVERG